MFVMIVGFYMGFGWLEWCLGLEMFKGLCCVVMSFLVGFLLVFMGIGGGSFGVFFMFLYNVLIYCVVVMVVGFGLVIVVSGVIGFLMFEVDLMFKLFFMIGVVNLIVFVIIVVMILIIVFWGVKLVYSMDFKLFKCVFVVFFVLVVINMFWCSFGF